MISEFRKKMHYDKLSFTLTLGMFLFIWFCGDSRVSAQEKPYPYKPIKIVIPFEPGGSIDIAVRVMTDYLTRELGVPMIVENRGGAGGMIGGSEVLRSKPDGYTLLAATDAVMIISPLKSPNPPYDTFKDFLPICAYGGSPVTFGVHKSSPLKTLADLVKEAKENPGKLTCAITQFGAENHLDLEIFRKAADVNIKIVPYKGPGEGAAALLGRHVDMIVFMYTTLLPYVKSGEARYLAAGASIPGSSIPTFAEAGFPRTTLPRYNAFFVSAKTPKPIHEKLVLAFKRVSTNPELIKKWETLGLFPDYKSPAEYTSIMKNKWDAYSKLIDDLGLKEK
jgi:tripartite-type tricarboxylate transporter receptor subunit TctC